MSLNTICTQMCTSGLGCSCEFQSHLAKRLMNHLVWKSNSHSNSLCPELDHDFSPGSLTLSHLKQWQSHFRNCWGPNLDVIFISSLSRLSHPQIMLAQGRRPTNLQDVTPENEWGTAGQREDVKSFQTEGTTGAQARKRELTRHLGGTSGDSAKWRGA